LRRSEINETYVHVIDARDAFFGKLRRRVYTRARRDAKTARPVHSFHYIAHLFITIPRPCRHPSLRPSR
ncbi:hypothetical protein KCU67_g110, partial [Aureobasidium melanogenum]